jgi:hypothetical protein
MDHLIGVAACRKVYAALRLCPDLCHVAAYEGYLVAYVTHGDPGPPWEPVMHADGLPVFCQLAGSIHGARPV